MTIGWKPFTSLKDVFNQFKYYINNPPLLVEINFSQNANNKYAQWQNLHQTKKNNQQQNNNKLPAQNKNNTNKISTAKLYDIIDTKSIEMSNFFSTLT